MVTSKKEEKILVLAFNEIRVVYREVEKLKKILEEDVFDSGSFAKIINDALKNGRVGGRVLLKALKYAKSLNQKDIEDYVEDAYDAFSFAYGLLFDIYKGKSENVKDAIVNEDKGAETRIAFALVQLTKAIKLEEKNLKKSA